MKRVDLLRHLASHECQLLREGGRHSVYYNPSNLRTAAVPRHREIGEHLCRKICDELSIPRP